MKTIEVVAAIISDGSRYLATQRAYGQWQGWWEFPGGKIELGEKPEEALRREISEELAVDIEVGALLTTVEYDYPDFHLVMHCYMCRLGTKPLQLQEHSAARWLAPHELDSVAWLPADIEVVEALRRLAGLD